MKPFRTIAALLALSLSAAVQATPDDHFLLTPALVQKAKAAHADFEKAGMEQSEQDDQEDDKVRKNGELPVERFIASIERRPAAKGILGKHGLSPKEFGLATYALIDASLYLTLEAMAGKAEASKGFNKLTREQQANVNLVRKMGPSGPRK